MSSGGDPSLQRLNLVVAQHASSRSTAQQCVHECALPAGQSAAGQQPRPSTNHMQAGTAASLAVRHDRNGHIAVITNGRSISDCTDRLQLTARAEGVQTSAHRSAGHQHAPSAVPPQSVQVHAESQPSHGRTNAKNTAYRRRRRQRMQGSASSCS